MVEFVKEKSVEVVPDIWLDTSAGSSRWPPAMGYAQLMQAVKKRIRPDPSWPSHDIKLMSCTGKYLGYGFLQIICVTLHS